MIEPVYPHDEEQRLNLLQALNIFDSAPIEELDCITRLAASHFHVPIVLISLIDADRQWFLSRVGLDVAETSRNVSFCAHTILQSSDLIVSDARLDPRFARNPLVIDKPYIVFYAACPLRSKEGIALGTFCLVDYTPRTLNSTEIDALHDFAAMAERYLHHRESLYQNKKIADDLARSEAVFEQTFSSAAVGFATLSLSGHWTRVNPTLCQMFGYLEHELIGLSYQSMTHPDDLDKCNAYVASLLNGESDSFHTEKRYFKADHSVIWVEVSVSIVRAPNGLPLHCTAVMNDITQRKLAENKLLQLQHELEHRVRMRTQELESAVTQLHCEMEQRIQIQHSLSLQKEYFRATLQNASDAIIEVDQEWNIISWNRAAELYLGWTTHEALALTLPQLLHINKFDFIEQGFTYFIDFLRTEKRSFRRTVVTAYRKDGSTIPMEMTATENTIGERQLITLFIQDVSERTRWEQALLSSKNQLRAITDNLPVWISHVDRNLRFTFINQTYCRWLNRTPESVLGHHIKDILSPEVWVIAEAHIQETLRGKVTEHEVKTTIDNENVYLQTTLVPCDSAIGGFYCLTMDITELKQLQDRLCFEANHDPLTGLPNRRHFHFTLNQSLEQLKNSDHSFALLFLDMDDFKICNDKYGHEFGDLVLKAFARVLHENIRSDDFIARLGGDEFTIILHSLTSPEENAEQVAQQITLALSRVIKVAGVPLTLSSSIGIAIAHGRENITGSVLLARADHAMYRAKMAGKSGFVLDKQPS